MCSGVSIVDFEQVNAIGDITLFAYSYCFSLWTFLHEIHSKQNYADNATQTQNKKSLKRREKK